jgi:hypothetical protein
MEPWVLILIGAALVIIGTAWSSLAIRSSRRDGDLPTSYEPPQRRGTVVPQVVVLLYLVGLAVVAAGVIWWLVDAP